MTQFADDTTMLLDGSQSSLQATLNTLEIFGSMSGLKMNTDKTKIIWIGRKKFSRDKLSVSVKLHWGETEFTLLGITFSVTLKNMPQINYDKALLKAQNILNSWKRRKMSPLGKVTVVKTFIMTQFNHLFASIPLLTRDFIKHFNNFLYKYLWDQKPDKISRIQITRVRVRVRVI